MPKTTLTPILFHRQKNLKGPLLTPTILSILFIFLSSSFSATAQKPEQRFNRFQWHSYKWQVFHTGSFHIYFPKGYDSLASYTAKELPEATQRIKRTMGTGILKTPHIIHYPSVHRLYESNIGLFEPEENTLPTFISKGNRMVLFYDGNYEHLKTQLYEALTRSVWEAQLKTGIADQAKGKAGREDIPFWFKEGAIKYFASQWPIAQEDALRQSFEQQQFNNWQESISYQPRLSGQAFCYFLAEKYYPQAVVQTYHQLRKKKNLARSLRLITKKPLDSLYVQCHAYYKQRFKTTDSNQNTSNNQRQSITTIPRKKGIVRNVQISPDQSQVAYTIYRNNQRTLYSYNTQTKETTKRLNYKLPPWINDYNPDMYPLLQWTDDSRQLTATYPKKGKISLTPYSPQGQSGETITITAADGVNSLVPLSNQNYLLAAYTKGQSDIVTYNTGNEKYTAYTNDSYDDTKAIANSNKANQILITSTRTATAPTAERQRTIGFKDTTKPKQGIYSITGKEINPVITDSIPYIKWDKPVMLSGNRLLATHTIYGTERFAIIPNIQQANKPFQTLGHYSPYNYHPRTEQISTTKSHTDSIEIITEPLSQWITNTTTDTTSPWLTDYHNRAAMRAREDSIIRASKDGGASFLEGVLLSKNAKSNTKQTADSIAASLRYNHKNVKPYILQLHSAYFSAKVNNDYFINRYQPYKSYQGQFKFPEAGGLAQGGFTDLFENHHISIGFRLPAGTEGSDFFIKYENTAKKIDWGISYFRKVESLQADPKRNWTDESGRAYPNNAKVKTHYAEISLHHPLNYYLSAGFQEAIRYDRTIFLATDTYTLKFEDLKTVWSISTLSLNYTKLQATLPMLYKGYKAKALLDIFQPLTTGNGATVTGNTLQLEYHQPIYKYITWVTQLQTSYSGGQNKVLYNLGGMDNNLTVRVDSTIQPKQQVPYSFQTLVTPLRGYLQNRLYGNQYLLFCNDIYVPLFQTIIPIETPLQFINLLQFGMFADIATVKETWNTANPDNVRWYWSYGASARTTLAGYPIRVDVAWPGTFSKQPLWYFSLNLK